MPPRYRALAALAALLALPALGAALYVFATRGGLTALAPPLVDPAAWQDAARALEAAERPARAEQLRRACAEPDCGCVEVTAAALLELGDDVQAPKLIAGVEEQCGEDLRIQGVLAEVAARAGRHSQGQRLAEDLLQRDPENPYAHLALALVAFEDKTKMGETRSAAQKAAELGRGPDALRLLGLAAAAQGELDLAKEHLEAALREAPRDLEIAFNLASVSDRLGRYRDTREGYLRVLRIDPKHAEARFRLAAMTHRAGARAEADHHRRKLAEIVGPDDERLGALGQLFEAPSPDGGVVTGRVVAAESPDG